jgi:hypothetical protein
VVSSRRVRKGPGRRPMSAQGQQFLKLSEGDAGACTPAGSHGAAPAGSRAHVGFDGPEDSAWAAVRDRIVDEVRDAWRRAVQTDDERRDVIRRTSGAPTGTFPPGDLDGIRTDWPD